MTPWWLALGYGVLGTCIGSFLNTCIDRIPHGQSVVFPASHCAICSRRLAPWELAPVLSYVLLRGRCRSCGVAIPVRIPLVEALTGAGFAALWWRLGPGWALVGASALMCVMLLVAATDLEHQLIPNRVVYPALALAPLVAVAGGHTIWESVAGAAVGFGLMAAPYLLTRGGMGAGDVKLAALIGAGTGFPEVLVALFAGVVAGGLVALVLLASGRRGRKDAIPFGPFLAAGGAVGLLAGRPIAQWYFGGWF